MGTLRIELGTGDSFKETADPAAAASEGGNTTGITPFSAAFRKKQVLVAKLNSECAHEVGCLVDSAASPINY